MSKKPTVGQSVHFYRNAGAKPLAGTIAAVLDDGKVNLGCLDVNGVPYAYGQKNVKLLQDGEDTPDKGGWCEYPPTDPTLETNAAAESVTKPEKEKAELKQSKESAKSDQQKADVEGDSKDAKAKSK